MNTWELSPPGVKLMAMFVVVLTALAFLRLLKAGWRLFQILKKPISSNHIGYAGTESVSLAVNTLMTAGEEQFSSLWLDCFSRVRGARRLSIVATCLSVLSVTYGATPIFLAIHGETLPRDVDITSTGLVLFAILGFELPLCMAAYCMSGYFEDMLHARKKCWREQFVRSRVQHP